MIGSFFFKTSYKRFVIHFSIHVPGFIKLAKSNFFCIGIFFCIIIEFLYKIKIIRTVVKLKLDDYDKNFNNLSGKNILLPKDSFDISRTISYKFIFVFY